MEACLKLVTPANHLSRFMPEIMVSAVGDETVALCIAFLRSSGYIKNPYLKSSLVTVLYAGTFSIGKRYPQGILGGLLIGSDFANEHLLHALMKFYIGKRKPELYHELC